jgi:hypothetical protein
MLPDFGFPPGFCYILWILQQFPQAAEEAGGEELLHKSGLPPAVVQTILHAVLRTVGPREGAK